MKNYISTPDLQSGTDLRNLFAFYFSAKTEDFTNIKWIILLFCTILLFVRVSLQYLNII